MVLRCLALQPEIHLAASLCAIGCPALLPLALFRQVAWVQIPFVVALSQYLIGPRPRTGLTALHVVVLSHEVGHPRLLEGRCQALATVDLSAPNYRSLGLCRHFRRTPAVCCRHARCQHLMRCRSCRG